MSTQTAIPYELAGCSVVDSTSIVSCVRRFVSIAFIFLNYVNIPPLQPQ
nr:MAG TPA: hypothetical protein [Bacteriophage sp.]